jgi:gluconolactonase
MDRRSNNKLPALVDENVPLEKIGDGFVFTEGPVWNPTGESLLFSDIPTSTRWRWDERAGCVAVSEATQKGNGMALDNRARILVCEHATSCVVRMDADGVGRSREVIASHYHGKELNSPNDIVVRSDESIYFTDPAAGRQDAPYGVGREQELDFQGVFRLSPGGNIELLVDDFVFPNGLCFSPDESSLYVNDSRQHHIRVFVVNSDGSLAGGRVFASGIVDSDVPGGVDGMKCDEQGNVWVTGPGGVWIFDPRGERIGTIDIPEVTANLAFGGSDGRSLFLTASRSLYRLRTKVMGCAFAL